MEKPIVIINKFDSSDVIATSGGLFSGTWVLSNVGDLDDTNDSLIGPDGSSITNVGFNYYYNGTDITHSTFDGATVSELLTADAEYKIVDPFCATSYNPLNGNYTYSGTWTDDDGTVYFNFTKQ